MFPSIFLLLPLPSDNMMIDRLSVFQPPQKKSVVLTGEAMKEMQAKAKQEKEDRRKKASI